MKTALTVGDIYDAIDKFAPFETQMSFDNAGLLIGNRSDSVSKVAVALDATIDTVKSAADNKCELLITHHPIIFNPIKSMRTDSEVYAAVKLGVAVISAHTNLDAADGGVNDCLAKAIGMNNVSKLSDGSPYPPMARIGDIQSMSDVELALHLKKALGCGGVKTVRVKDTIKRVAVCGGAGGDFIVCAKEAGADALITGECKHHERLLAKRMGINLYECGHYCTEQIVKSKIAEIISELCDEVVVLDESDPAEYI